MPIAAILALIGVAPTLIEDVNAIFQNMIAAGRTQTTAEEDVALAVAVERVNAERAAFEAGKQTPQVNA